MPPAQAGTWLGGAGLLLATFLTAWTGGRASLAARDFYRRLDLPAWAPPGWLFGPVWTLLYLMMAWAAWRIWRTAGAHPALLLYLAQLLLNGLWSWIFFRWRRGGWALAEILLLWLTLAATLVSFHSLDALAGRLLLPYLAWVSFATLLTWEVRRRNPVLPVAVSSGP